MAALLPAQVFFSDLEQRIEQHCQQVAALFQPLPPEIRQWQPAPNEWNIDQCFDHLNRTHAYYVQRIIPALAAAPRTPATGYKPSFWGGTYMFFALNPRLSFPADSAIAPAEEPSGPVLHDYLQAQQQLQHLIVQSRAVDVRATRIPIERGVQFNLGDCLKVLVYHDELHLGQALRVLADYRQQHTAHG